MQGSQEKSFSDAYYELDQHTLHAVFATRELQDLFNRSFKAFLRSTANGQSTEYGSQCGSDHKLYLKIEQVLPVPTASQMLWSRGEMPNSIKSSFVCHASKEDSLIVVDDCVALFTNYQTRESHLVALPNYQPAALQGLMLNAFVDAAHTGGQIVMHAAALSLPNQAGLVLIHAPSGTGKTTTSLILMASGFRLASDDLAFVCSGETPTGYGLPRSLKVHRDTAKLLQWVEPKLSNTEWDSESERPLHLENLEELAPITKPEVMPLVAIMRLTRRPGKSEIKPAKPSDVLASLVADNVRRGEMTKGLLPTDRERLKGYAALVSNLPLFDLFVGEDHCSLAKMVQNACGA